MSPFRCFSTTFRECLVNLSCSPFFLMAVVAYSIYYCWPYMAQLPEHITVTIVDEDNSPLSRRMVRALDSAVRLKVLGVTGDRREAMAQMRENRTSAILGIPPDFELHALSGVPTAMTLVTNGAFIVKSRSAFSGASGPLQEAATAAIAAHLVENGLPATDIAQAAMRAPALVIQPMYNNISGYLNFVVPIVFMIIFQTLMICGAGMLLNDWFSRKKYPLQLVKALRSPIYLFAIQLPVCCICFFWVLFVEGAAFYLHGVNSFQNIPATLAMGGMLALAISSTAIAAGMLLKSSRFIIQLVVPSSIPCVFISGNLWPTQNIPVCMRALAWFIPSTPGSCGMLRASQCGATLSEVAPYLGHLLLLAILYFLLACIFSRLARKNIPVQSGLPH